MTYAARVLAVEPLHRLSDSIGSLESQTRLSGPSSNFSKKLQLPIWPTDDLSPVFPRQIYSVLTNPETSKAGWFISLIIIMTIMVSIAALVIESLPRYRYPFYGTEEGDSAPALELIEFIAIIIFTIEYGLKLLTVWSQTPLELHISDFESNSSPTLFIRKYMKFILHPLNLVDLVAFLPFYLTLGGAMAGSGLAVFRVLRVGRIFRVFKLGRYSGSLNIFGVVIGRSLALLANIMFMVFLMIVLFGSLVYFVEMGEWNSSTNQFERQSLTGDMEKSPFSSILIGCDWVIQTATTVGYGDFYTTTISGRIVAILTMMIALVLMSFPVTVVASNYTDFLREAEVEKDRQEQLTKRGGEPTRQDHLKAVQEIIDEVQEIYDTLHYVRRMMLKELASKDPLRDFDKELYAVPRSPSSGAKIFSPSQPVFRSSPSVEPIQELQEELRIAPKQRSNVSNNSSKRSTNRSPLSLPSSDESTTGAHSRSPTSVSLDMSVYRGASHQDAPVRDRTDSLSSSEKLTDI